MSRMMINRDFSLLWFGQALSSFGEFFFGSTVIVWLATEFLNGNPLLPDAIALVVLCGSIPRILVSPIAGVLVDRWSPKKVMIAADMARVILFLSCFGSLCLWADHQILPLILILGVVALNSIGAQFFNPARAAVMQLVIPQDKRADAASWSMFSVTGVAIISAASAPAIFVVSGIYSALIINVFVFSGSALCVCYVINTSGNAPGVATTMGFWKNFCAGINFSWKTPAVRTVVIGMFLYGLALGINNSVLALFALKTLSLSAPQYGLVTASFPCGAGFATLFSASIFRKFAPLNVFVIAIIFLGFTYVAYSQAQGFTSAVATMFFCGLFFSVFSAVQGPILQGVVIPGFMGRVSSILSPSISIASLLGTLISARMISALPEGQRLSVLRLDPYSVMLLVSAAILIGGGLLMSFGATEATDP
jgi:MFS family permease